MIHVCYGLYDKDGRYSKFTGTSMLSMFENTSASPHSIIVHILHDNTLSADNRDKFIYIAGMYGQIVKFYNIEELCTNSISIFRFTIMELFDASIKKIIYLDSDIIVNLDIRELWQTELDDAPLAAVPEIDIEPPNISRHYLMKENFVDYRNYFNTGVLFLNLQVLKNERETIRNGIKFVSEHPCEWFDQDILNYCFSERYVSLPEKFDVFTNVEHETGKSAKIRSAIYHYIGSYLGLNTNDLLNQLWFKYFAKTPWFNENAIGHLYDGMRHIYIEQKNFATQISALMSGRTRAFFVQPNMLEAVRKIFYVKPEEEIIAADSPESLQRAANSLAARDKIFFVLANYPAVHAAFTRAGFVEGRDFLNAALFLSDAHGVPLNTYPLIKLL